MQERYLFFRALYRNMGFLDENYLLDTEIASEIYKEIKDLPVVDAHNHANVQEIAENKHYTDIWQAEAATDHYVWEMMRKRGVDEAYITGEKPNHEKWMKLCDIFPDLVGNPTYEWVHLDLKRRLGIEAEINTENAQMIWDKAQEVFAQEEKRPQALLKEMNIESMCSTDDPLDLLEHHQAVAKAMGENYIRPTWRPDKAMNIHKEEWPAYIDRLADRVDKPITTLDELIEALEITHQYFAEHGCLATDHGVEFPFGYEVDKEEAEEAFRLRREGEDMEMEHIPIFMSYMLHEFARMNAKAGFTMQIHLGAVRDVRDSLYERLGPDTGGDICNHMIEIVDPLRDFLNAFDEFNEDIPEDHKGLKIVLYCVDPAHYPTLATLSRAFGKNVSLGAAWWFNDSPHGMSQQLKYISTVDVLANFGGMVTDSRKLLSYGSRTEMFRRVLANEMGLLVKRGQVPKSAAIRVAKFICYEGPKTLFGF